MCYESSTPYGFRHFNKLCGYTGENFLMNINLKICIKFIRNLIAMGHADIVMHITEWLVEFMLLLASECTSDVKKFL